MRADTCDGPGFGPSWTCRGLKGGGRPGRRAVPTDEATAAFSDGRLWTEGALLEPERLE
jgi:hypothetical protein